jgi:hypothetical protein
MENDTRLNPFKNDTSAFLYRKQILQRLSRGILFVALLLLIQETGLAQGIWTPLTNKIPDANGDLMVMLLLSDGTVMAKTDSCSCDTLPTATWSKLTPDIHGSYVNGTWSRLAPMHESRVYFASQVLKDGRVFVAGGEYGTGGFLAETYDPLSDHWTPAPAQPSLLADANSEILPDGRVLVGTDSMGWKGTLLFDPSSNSWTTGPFCHGNHDETAWIKLPDNSLLFVDVDTTSTERYIPALNKWVVDRAVPVSLYDSFGSEAGAAFLLPDGRAFFLGSTGHTAYYVPSGNVNPGNWTAGPDIPAGMGTPDAAAAMMVNGKIMCAVSPVPFAANHFPTPTYFYEFDYLSNSFLAVKAPNGTDTLNSSCYMTNMLDLPDGSVLFSTQNSSQCYIYTPGGTALSIGKPTIKNYTQDQCGYRVTGTRFNGISEGAAYGDDWQMASNYPIVRLSSGANVYYARTSGWNRTGVQTGNLPDTAAFTVPASMPSGSYSLEVIANGIASDPISFMLNPCSAGIDEFETSSSDFLIVYPNPTDDLATIKFQSENGGSYSIRVLDILGRTVREEHTEAVAGENAQILSFAGVAKGIYLLVLKKGQAQQQVKISIR